MKFSYNEIWAAAVGMLRENLAIATAISGAFLFLPTLLSSYFIPLPETAQPTELVRLWSEYWFANWHWMLLVQLATLVGSISLLLLFLRVRGGTVGGMIGLSLAILPFYILPYILTSIIVLIGFMLLIVPGLYALGRLILVSPVIVAEGQRNPISAITRSLQLTRRKGWAVTGMLLLVAIAGIIVGSVIVMLLGIIFYLVASVQLSAILVKIIQALTSAALNTVILAVVAALYQRLSGLGSTSAASTNGT